MMLTTIPLASQVPIKGSTVDATVGYKYNGTAPNNHVLCGNGVEYIDAVSCGLVANPFYQSITNDAGIPVAPRANIQFSVDFGVIDLGTGPNATEIVLAATIASNTTGNASTATHANTADTATNATNAGTAANANAVGGVSLAGLCQTSGTGCPVVTATYTNVVSSRAVATQYQNTDSAPRYVSGWFNTNGGNTVSTSCIMGPFSANMTVWATVWGATVSGGLAGFACPRPVPPGWFYEITGSGTGFTGINSWYEGN